MITKVDFICHFIISKEFDRLSIYRRKLFYFSTCCFHLFASGERLVTYVRIENLFMWKRYERVCTYVGTWKFMSIDCVCLKKCKACHQTQIMIEKENFENKLRNNLYSRHFFFCLIATSSLSRLPFWNCPGEQCWRLCEAKPRDAWVYEKVHCTSHPGWSGVSKVRSTSSVQKFSMKRSLATDAMFVGFF